jgi:hypothetical protein
MGEPKGLTPRTTIPTLRVSPRTTIPTRVAGGPEASAWGGTEPKGLSHPGPFHLGRWPRMVAPEAQTQVERAVRL